jgi:uncharacterized membrane protein YhaH (DUF805 family)
MTNVASGWYKDPADPSKERFWNGTSWTEQTRAGASQPSVGSSPDWSDITPVNAFPTNSYQSSNLQQNFNSSTSSQQNFSMPVNFSSGSQQSDLAPRPVSMIDALTRAFSKYADFKGRASKSEFWFFYLWSVIFSLPVLFIPALSIISIVWILASFIPQLAVGVRRLHDIGKSGGYYFFILIPLVGPIILIVFWASDAERNDNMYGPAR